MKKLLFVAVLALSSVMMKAQSIGVKASVGTVIAKKETTYVGSPFDYVTHQVRYDGSSYVRSVGVFAQEKFGFLFGRAELDYTSFTQKYEVNSYIQLNEGANVLEENWKMIDFNLIAGLNIENFRVGAGPVAHYLVGHDTQLDKIASYNEDMRNVTFGFNFSVGLDIDNIHIDLRYVDNFRTVGDHIKYGERLSRFSVSPDNINITLGYSF